MRRNLFALLALCALLAPVRSAAQVLPGYNPPPDGSGSLRVFRSEQFRKVNAALTGWRVAWKGHDLQATLARYTEDATLLLPNGALL